MLISPNALHLANEHNISLVGKLGSGKEGRIILKDVEKLIAEEDDSKELNISDRALKEANDSGLKEEEIAEISGSGKDGRILLEDIKTYASSKSESSDNGKGKGKGKKKGNYKKEQESSDDEPASSDDSE